MGSFKRILASLFCAFICSCRPTEPIEDTNLTAIDSATLPVIPESKLDSHDAHQAKINLLIHQGKINDAIDEILLCKEHKDFYLESKTLERLGLALLRTGMYSDNNQDMLLSLYGTGISLNEKSIPLIEYAMFTENVLLQQIAVTILARYDTEETNRILEVAMRSCFPIVRLEAAYILASKRTPSAYGQIEALMTKLDERAKPVFCELFAIEGQKDSMSQLHRMLFDRDEEVQIEAILALSSQNRDDVLPILKAISKEPTAKRNEALSYALGKFQDSSSCDFLRIQAQNHSDCTALAALASLYTLGEEDAYIQIEQRARSGDLFAISLLGTLQSGSVQVLYEALKSSDMQIRCNAAISLLQRKDPRCINSLYELFIDTPKDLAFYLVYSPAKTMSHVNVVSSATLKANKIPFLFEQSLSLREQLLSQTLELSEEHFLSIAEAILLNHQLDLVPILMSLLENMRSDKAIELLKAHQMHLGVPYIRAWANLVLFRLHEEGPWAKNLIDWIRQTKDDAMFEPRVPLPFRMRSTQSPHKLSLDQKAELLIGSFEALSEGRNEEGICTLLYAIRHGNPHNRYTLSGLLMRASS